MNAIPKLVPVRDRKYLDSLREGPCIVTGATGTPDNLVCEPAHLRLQNVAGMGQKPQDCHALSLHWQLHRKQNNRGEGASWLTLANEHPLFVVRIFNEYPDLLEKMLLEYAERKYETWLNR